MRPRSLVTTTTSTRTPQNFHTTTSLQRAQRSLPAAYYRGGTSRAVIFRSEDLPPDQEKWPAIFRGIINSPDPNGRQLDGIGGGVSSLSKVCVVGPSERPDADVDYTFAAIGVKTPEVDFSSNCGNMSSAIGPFAVDAGLVQADDGPVTVRIHNTNTGKIIHANFCMEHGEAKVSGDFAIDGVAGTGAKIELAFKDPAGSKTGTTLPTGNLKDTFDGITATCIDVGNPCVFVQASDLEVEGSILADAIEAHPTLLSRLDSIRRQAAVAMGIAKDFTTVPGSIPKIAMVSPPRDHPIIGRTLRKEECDLVVRAVSVGQPHRAVPITVAMALAVASRIKGSVVHGNTSESRVDDDGITIAHNSGKILVGANFDDKGEVKDATVYRTARRIMDGMIYWKDEVDGDV
ncbi:PrpF protein [Phaeosphaeria sp. MPI-PUGE-AT-0046c]|nr:PrpF protein [Phaeosphaeria sp. MPI-PUGE-AT-0046c]